MESTTLIQVPVKSFMRISMTLTSDVLYSHFVNICMHFCTFFSTKFTVESFQTLSIIEHTNSSFDHSEKPYIILRKYLGRWELASEMVVLGLANLPPSVQETLISLPSHALSRFSL